jgi:5S rRNA maturation endonuclease (ribonuclease M5)
VIRLRDRDLDVDVLGELWKYDWTDGKIRGEKFLACSPFRSERHPSFAVRLDTGVWIDSGADDETWKKGNFVRLLSWLRNETYEETEEYLLSEYGPVMFTDADALRLDLGLTLGDGERPPLDLGVLERYRYRHKYLTEQRGIDDRTLRAFRVGYDPASRAVTFPWLGRSGELVNIKFRSVRDKRFWYYAGGLPIRDHVYGLYMLHRVQDRARARRVFIVESEIDALTLWMNGFAALALGGANMSAKQRDLLLQSPAEEFVIATDNDMAGKRIAGSIIRQLNGYLPLKELRLPDQVKDVNDLTSRELAEVMESVRDVSYKFQ